MQLLVLVLNKVECLEDLLQAMLDEGISGATVLESTGMARVLGNNDEAPPIFGSLRLFMDPEREGSRTLLMAVTDEQVGKIRAIVRRVTGGLDQPDTGVLFTVPILTVEGIGGAGQ